MNADKILFRCSSLGYLMTEPKNKSEKLSETTKTHLVDVYVANVYGRHTEIDNKFLSKGNAEEENAITAYSLVKKRMFKKNSKRLNNDFISGEPDLFIGESIHKADAIIDTKTSWDVFTYSRAKASPLNKMYFWQGMGYMALTGAKECTIAYCLINTPYQLVNRELYNESYKHPDNNTPAWREIEIIKNHVYDINTFKDYVQQRGCYPVTEKDIEMFDSFIEIPLDKRVHEKTFARNDEHIGSLYKRIKDCREWMNENLFDKPLVMLATHCHETNAILIEKGEG